MAKLQFEICIISARGLGRSSSLWRPQWFAVGWIDPNNKYCTKIDTSGSPNPTWKTKFSVPVENTSANLQGLSLTIEVYRREPIFLGEKLQGTATVMLKEFFTNKSGVEETASFQLRKRSLSKPQGFVDISVRLFENKEGVYSESGYDDSFGYSDSNSGISLAIEDGPVVKFPTEPTQNQFGGYSCNQFNDPYRYPSQPALRGEADRRTPTPPPPPPPPPSNTGFLPSLFPGNAANHMPLPETYINMHATGPSGQARQGGGPGFGVGLGTGALAAGAVIFGDDFLSGPSFPAGLDDGSSLALSADPPF